MKTIKQKECKINSTDLWIIGSSTLFGLCTGFFMPQQSVITFLACLTVGAGLGMVISSLVPKKQIVN